LLEEAVLAVVVMEDLKPLERQQTPDTPVLLIQGVVLVGSVTMLEHQTVKVLEAQVVQA
jgi:hypothetical protein